MFQMENIHVSLLFYIKQIFRVSFVSGLELVWCIKVLQILPPAFGFILLQTEQIILEQKKFIILISQSREREIVFFFSGFQAINVSLCRFYFLYLI